MKYQICSCIAVVLTFISTHLPAQNVAEFTYFEEIQLNNYQEGKNELQISYPFQTKNIAISYSPELNQVFFLHDSTLVEIDLNNRVWVESKLNFSPIEPFNLGYSNHHKSLLLWEAGVGRVFELDSTYTLKRIDHSFNHRSQYQSFQWIESTTGSIHALGGYGLFETKTHLVRFNLNSGDWELVEYDDPLSAPIMILAGLGFYDYTNQIIYLIKGNTSVDEFYSGKSTFGKATLWSYSIPDRSWRKEYVFNDNSNHLLSLTFIDLLKSKHIRLPIMMFPTYGNSVINPACFFHTEKYFLRCLESPQKQLFYQFGTLNMIWSDRDQAFYLIGSQAQVGTERFIIRIIKMTITDEQAFMQWLETDESPWYKATGLWLTIGVFAVGLVVFGLYYRTKYKGISNSGLLIQQNSVTIVQSETGVFSLVGQVRTIDELPAMEQKLLMMLVEAFRIPDTYLKSDEIDLVLVPDHPSQDYIRRLRNLTLERLEELFQSAGNESVNYILRRTTLADKRKNEYRLNDSCILLQ